MKSFKSVVFVLIAISILLLAPSESPKAETGNTTYEGSYIDAHAHLMGRFGNNDNPILDYEGAVEAAITEMDALNIKTSFMMPTPFTINQDNVYEADDFITEIAKYPGRFKYLAGGGTLNVMIQQAVSDGSVSEATKTEFRAKAEELIASGAIGFGEMAVEHISIGGTEPHVEAPADHELFLLLADIAAELNVPIDIHMEAITEETDTPSQFDAPQNPDTIPENITGFETLLSHNRNAKIIWDHVGWDTVGQRTASLTRSLLEKHSNLYLSIKHTGVTGQNAIVDLQGNLDDEWVQLLTNYSDHFILGSDQFYKSPLMTGTLPEGAEPTVGLLDYLSGELVYKIAYVNPTVIFRLDGYEELVDDGTLSASLTLNKTSFVTGDPFQLSLALSGGSTSYDIYTAVVFPDGSFNCLTSIQNQNYEFGETDSALPLFTNYSVTDLSLILFATTDLPELPEGDYQWLVVVTAPDADVFDTNNWLATTTSTFTISP